MSRWLRRAFFLAVGLSGASGGAWAAGIRDGYARHLEAAHFQTVGEFLTGTRDDGDRVVLRTQPAERGGEYFILTLETPVAAFPAGAEVILSVVPTDAKEAKEYRFSVANVHGKSRELYLGVTGSDWSDPSVDALAWQVRVVSGQSTVAEWKSFLWEMP